MLHMNERILQIARINTKHKFNTYSENNQLTAIIEPRFRFGLPLKSMMSHETKEHYMKISRLLIIQNVYQL